MRVFEKISAINKKVKAYYTEAKEEITRTNLISLKICCLAGLLFFVLFCIGTPLIINTWKVTGEYYFCGAVFLVFLIAYFILNSAKKPNVKAVEIICDLFYTACLLSFIIIGVFPYRTSPQYYLIAFYIIMPVLLIQRPIIPFSLILSGEILFLLLAYRYKTPDSFSQDLFNTIASIAFSIIVLISVNRLRISDYNARAELRRMSTIDNLTGLLNKSAFDEAGNAAMQRELPNGGDALLILDLDNFKNINDTLGHMMGDSLLTDLGYVLRETLPPYDILGRFGGDEFCILMRGIHNSQIIDEIIAKIQEKLAKITLNGSPSGCTCSVGVAYPIGASVTYDTAFKVADSNLYYIKTHGKNSHRITKA